MRNADMPAMPSGIQEDYNNLAQEPLNLGLTKREYFAAMAMQGMMANDDALRRMAEAGEAEMISPNTLMASACLLASDALLAELERTK